jgi:ribosomal protein S18 acetylase RimI-like enzyme
MLQTLPNSLRRIPFEQGLDALRLAADAWPPEERAGQLAALREQIRAGRASDLVLVEARANGVLVGAALAQVLAGRAAVVWHPRVVAGREVWSSLAQELFGAVHAELALVGVHLAQSLVRSDDGATREAFVSAGYVHAGDLLYMAAVVEAGLSGLTPTARRGSLTFVSYSDNLHDELVQIVAATYRGSLDCPLVDGLRETKDVLAGYQAVGEFRPELWLLVRCESRDVGCLLLADHPSENHLEIVYTGLVPEVRGRGWGRQLTARALDAARQLGRQHVVLAVDAANWPAIAMYEVLGFVAWDRRSVLVRNLRRAVSSAATTT